MPIHDADTGVRLDADILLLERYCQVCSNEMHPYHEITRCQGCEADFHKGRMDLHCTSSTGTFHQAAKHCYYRIIEHTLYQRYRNINLAGVGLIQATGAEWSRTIHARQQPGWQMTWYACTHCKCKIQMGYVRIC